MHPPPVGRARYALALDFHGDDSLHMGIEDNIDALIA